MPQSHTASPIYDSAPDLTTTDDLLDQVSLSAITSRFNKRRRGDAEDYSDVMEDIRGLLSTSMNKQEAKFNSLQTLIAEIRDQNVKITESVQFMSDKYDEIKITMEKMEAERSTNLTYIKTLEDKIDYMERNMRSSSLEIRNISPKQGESKTDLIQMVKQVGIALNVPIESSNIRNIYRTFTKKPTNKPIIVELTSVITKERIIDSMKKFKKDKNVNHLTTVDMRMDGPPTPVYVADNLTTKTRRLFAITRDFANTNNYTFCWTSHGNVYLRKAEKEPLCRINCEEDLKKLSQ